MAFTALTTAQTNADSPLDTTLFDTIRTNLDDHETRIVSIVNTSSAGDYLICANDTERTTTSTSYVKLKEIKIGSVGTGATLRIKYDFKNDVNLNSAWAKIYKNTSAVGTESSNNTTSFVTISEDISGLADGDLLQLYVKEGGAATARVANFRIYEVAPMVAGILHGY